MSNIPLFKDVFSIGNLFEEERMSASNNSSLRILSSGTRKFLCFGAPHSNNNAWLIYETNDEMISLLKQGKITIKEAIEAVPDGTSVIVTHPCDSQDFVYRVFVNVAHKIAEIPEMDLKI